jgi:S1-C subfamily serine protease
MAGLPAGPAKEPEPAVPAGPVPADMAADVVQKVKQSTAYLRVRMATGEVAQGSGFFALERGIVITNAHVVGMVKGGSPPRGVDVVMHSGEAGEARLAGTVIGVDRDNDLAVLRVQGDLSRLPPALAVVSAADLKELQNIYIFGFPFGTQLGKDITVSKSSVSSLRRRGGVLKEVQVNGGMNPGNSGGPVTDARGVVVGVSVAGITNTQINFAVPGDFIRPLVERCKSHPLELAPPPGPVARNDPPAGAPVGQAPGAGLEGDLAALKGTWQSGPVAADDGSGMGTVKLSISPQPGSQGGRIRLEIAAKQGGSAGRATLNYSFTLEQKGSERILVTGLRRGVRGTVRGMVFLYRFEGGQLILSGVIASGRSAYTLKNVALRRTAAEPEAEAAGNPAGAPPAAGGAAGGSPAALKFTGDVYTFVQEAVRDRRLADVDIRGFTLNKNTYRDVCEEGGVLIGFEFGLGKFGTNDVLKAWRPIFRTKDGEKTGHWHGPAPEAPVTVKAKPGYVVSALAVRSGLGIDALTLTFAKLGTNGLDLGDVYNSEMVGGNGGGPSSIGGNGALFVGVTGHLGADGSPSSFGLVAVLPK